MILFLSNFDEFGGMNDEIERGDKRRAVAAFDAAHQKVGVGDVTEIIAPAVQIVEFVCPQVADLSASAVGEFVDFGQRRQALVVQIHDGLKRGERGFGRSTFR